MAHKKGGGSSKNGRDSKSKRLGIKLGDGFVWLAAKMSFVLLFFLWIRASFPRYRYDQVMRLGWKVFIPVTLVWIAFLGAMMQTRWAYLFH